MLSDIVEQKDKILEQIKSQSVDFNNIQSILLLGSHLWGYANQDSDIDLLVIYKTKPEKLIQPFDKVTLEIQVDLAKLDAKMKRSNWDNYFTIKYCSYPLYGTIPELNFSRDNIVNWLKEKHDFHISTITEKPTKQGFLSIMSRVFYLNHFFSNVGRFKLEDFRYCEYLFEGEKKFLESQLTNLFEHKDSSQVEKEQMKQIAEKLQNQIINLESK